MKILIVNDLAVPAGGAETFTFDLRDELRRRGHDTRVFASTALGGPDSNMADYRCFGTTSRLRTLNRAANPGAFWRLKRVLREFKPDLVHVRMFMTQLSPLILPLLRNTPSLYHAAWYETICPTGLKLLPDRTVCRQRAGRVCHSSGCLSLQAWTALMFQRQLWERWRDAFDLVVANSEATRQCLVEHGIEPTVVAWNGVPRRRPRPPLSDPPTVGYVGRLSWEKGADVLIRGFAETVERNPTARLLVVGDGPERGSLEQLVPDLGLEARVQFLGQLPRSEMERALDVAWVQVVPSLMEEPFGLVAAEAMMRGTAVVATKGGGLSEIVENDRTGLLVPPGDSSAIASALNDVLGDRSRTEEMGSAGYARAVDKLSIEASVDRFVELYRGLIRSAVTTATPIPTSGPGTPVHYATLPFSLRRTLGYTSRGRLPYDSAVKLRVGEPTYLLTHPDDVRHVLVKNAANYRKTPFLASERGRRRAGRGLLTSAAGEHRRQRRLLQPLFHSQSVERYERAILDCTDRLKSRLRHGEEIDLAVEMTDLTQSVILAVLFGDELAGDGLDTLAEAIRRRRRYTEYVYHGRLPLREFLPTGVARRYRQAMEVIDAEIYSAIQRRRSNRGEPRDLISQLVEATYKDGSSMSDEQVRDEVLTFTSTGYETLGEAMTWAWYLLAGHPQADAELRAELKQVLAGRPPGAADLPTLSYTEMVLAETMRLYPPTWIFARIPEAHDKLPSGTWVPAGAKLYICQYVLHRHPRYFTDPERFDPYRFAPGRERPRFVYLPFGDGPHKCLGEHLAKLEGVLAVASLAQDVRFEPVDRGRVDPFAGITLRPRRGLRMRVELL